MLCAEWWPAMYWTPTMQRASTQRLSSQKFNPEMLHQEEAKVAGTASCLYTMQLLLMIGHATMTNLEDALASAKPSMPRA